MSDERTQMELSDTARRAIENMHLMYMKPIEGLDQVLGSVRFIFTIVPGELSRVRAYPVIGDRANYNEREGILNLYGTHWHYEGDTTDWDDLSLVQGDGPLVVSDAMQGIRVNRGAHYKFSVQQAQSELLWEVMIGPQTEPSDAWNYQERVVRPRWEADMRAYGIVKIGATPDGQAVSDFETLVNKARTQLELPTIPTQ